MTEAKIIQLGGLDDEDEAFLAFIEDLKEDVSRVTYLMEKKDGTINIGTNTKDARDLVFDLYRLQRFCSNVADSVDYSGGDDE